MSALVFSLVFIFERYVFEIPYNVGTYTPIGFMNNAGQVFNIWIPCLILYCYQQRNNRILCGLGFLGLLVVVSILMQAATRGTIIGLALSEFLVFLIVFKQNKKQAVVFLSITCLLTVGVVINKLSAALDNGRLSAKIEAMKQGLGSRAKIYKNSLDMTFDNPRGVGVNNFEYIHPKYAQPGTNKSSEYVNERQILRTPHNIILKIYTELGWLGGSIFLLLFIYVFSSAFYSAIKGGGIDKWLFVAVSATSFHSLFSAVFSNACQLVLFLYCDQYCYFQVIL